MEVDISIGMFAALCSLLRLSLRCYIQVASTCISLPSSVAKACKQGIYDWSAVPRVINSHGASQDHHRHRPSEYHRLSHTVPFVSEHVLQGVDDILAILLACSAFPEELEVLLVSVTYGNIDVQNCLRNVVSLFYHVEKEIAWRKDQGRNAGFWTLQRCKPLVAVGPEHPLSDDMLMADFFRKPICTCMHSRLH